MLTKFFVKKEARRILRKIRQLDVSQNIIDDLAIWRRSALNLIQKVYGTDSDLFKNLQDIHVEQPIELDPLELGKDLRSRVQYVIESFLQSVHKSGLPIGYRAPILKWLLSHLLPPFLAAAITFGATFFGFKLNQSAQVRQDRFKVTEVDFNDWYKYLRKEYRYGLDTVLQNLKEERGNRYPHGILADRQIAFAENFERQIEKTLDSFLMEYAIQGGDTLTLEYQRKPLGNLSSDLRNALYKRR